MTARMPKRPAKVIVGRVRARAQRYRAADGFWYWRAVFYRDGKEHPVWSGWATREQATEHLAALVAEGRSVPPPRRNQERRVRRMGELLNVWLEAQQ